MNPFHLGAALFVLSGKRHLGVVPFLAFCVWFTLFAGLILAIAWGGGPRGPMPSIAEVHRQARDFVKQCGEPCQPRSTGATPRQEAKRDGEQLRQNQLRRMGLNWQGKANWREIREHELRELAIEDGQATRAR